MRRATESEYVKSTCMLVLRFLRRLILAHHPPIEQERKQRERGKQLCLAYLGAVFPEEFSAVPARAIVNPDTDAQKL